MAKTAPSFLAQLRREISLERAEIPLLWRGGFDQREKTGWSVRKLNKVVINHPVKNSSNLCHPSNGGEFLFKTNAHPQNSEALLSDWVLLPWLF